MLGLDLVLDYVDLQKEPIQRNLENLWLKRLSQLVKKLLSHHDKVVAVITPSGSPFSLN
jgi:hypothetical protein